MTVRELIARCMSNPAIDLHQEVYIKGDALVTEYGEVLMSSSLVTVCFSYKPDTDNNNYIPAIKAVRLFTRCGLIEAKKFVDDIRVDGKPYVTISGEERFLHELSHVGTYERVGKDIA